MIQEKFKKEFYQVLLFWFLLCLSINLVLRLSAVPILRNVVALYTAFALLYSPLLFFKEAKDFFCYFEKGSRKTMESIKYLSVFCVFVFPLFFLANHFFQLLVLKTHYHALSVWRFEDVLQLCLLLLHQLLMVALPEEYFFRFFLWDKLEKCFVKTQGILFFGVSLNIPFFFLSFLFALSHSLIVLHWWHFAIFFPGLAFAWLRLKTGGLLAPVFFHAFCNMASFWIVRHYF